MNYLAPILLFACSRGELLGDSDRPAWDPEPQTISNSSSSTTVSWQPPEDEQGRDLSFYNVVVQSEFGTIATETQTLETTFANTPQQTLHEY